MAKGKKNVKKTDAQRHDEFKKLANIRGKRAIRAIQGLGKLASGRYRFTEKDVETMEAAFKKTLGEVFAAFGAALKAPQTAAKSDTLPDLL